MAFYVTVVSDYCEHKDHSYRSRLPQQLFFADDDEWSVAILDYKIKAAAELFVLCDQIESEFFADVEQKLLLYAPVVADEFHQVVIPRFKKVTVKQCQYISLRFVDRFLKSVKCDNFLFTLVFSKL